MVVMGSDQSASALLYCVVCRLVAAAVESEKLPTLLSRKARAHDTLRVLAARRAAPGLDEPRGQSLPLSGSAAAASEAAQMRDHNRTMRIAR